MRKTVVEHHNAVYSKQHSWIACSVRAWHSLGCSQRRWVAVAPAVHAQRFNDGLIALHVPGTCVHVFEERFDKGMFRGVRNAAHCLRSPLDV